MSTVPFFTVLTPSFNRAGSIARAVESVLAQGPIGVEHIIIDGGSTDGTLEVLRGYPQLKVISEPDRGMYDALNKGLRLARGEVIVLLNTDDCLMPDSLRAASEAFMTHPEAPAIMGGVSYEQEGREVNRRSAPAPALFLQQAGRNRVNFPNGWFLRRETYRGVGEFDPSYRYTADFDLLVRLILAGARPARVDATLYRYSIQPDSATLSPLDSRLPERGATLLKVYDELLRVAETYLSRRDLPHEFRRGLRASLSHSGYQLAATAFYHRRFAQASQAARRCLRHQPFWPLIFLYYAGRRALQVFLPALRLRD